MKKSFPAIALILAAALFIGLAGCSKKPAEKSADKEKAPAAESAKPAPAPEKSKYTFDMLCDTYVAAKKEAYKNDPMSEEGYAQLRDGCMEENAPQKAKEGELSEKIMKACEGKISTEWLYCYDTERSAAVK